MKNMINQEQEKKELANEIRGLIEQLNLKMKAAKELLLRVTIHQRLEPNSNIVCFVSESIDY